MIETGKTVDLLMLIAVCAMTMIGILYNRRGKGLSIRKLPALDAIDEAVASSAEKGRPVLYVPRGSLRASIDAPQTVASLDVLGRVATKCAELNVPMVCIYSDAEAEAGPLIAEKIQQSFLVGGHPELFREDTIRFFPQYTYTMGTMSAIVAEKFGACFYFGSYYHESIIYGETGQRIGAIQIAGTANTHQLPFFVTTCDYTLVGEELYAAGAYISEDPVLVGSIGGQDWAKYIILGLLVLGIATATLGITAFKSLLVI